MNGIEQIKKHFAKYSEQYTIIGGLACDLLMSDAGLPFRQTADVDMVIIVEALTTEFGKAFWEFIDAGGYSARQHSSGKPEFYRFVQPTNPDYPKMIELFSRPQSHVTLNFGTHLMPMHIDDEVSSLSAILLNDDYYSFLLDGRTTADGISILDAEHIIPLKMKAWLDLSEKKNAGLHVDAKDLKKHRLDVFRLYQLLDETTTIAVPASVKADINSFLDQMGQIEMNLSDIGIRRPKEAILDLLRKKYR